MKKCQFSLLFFLTIGIIFLPTCALASPQTGLGDLTIEAQSVVYHQDSNVVEATGSVEVRYQNIKIEANHLFCDTKLGTVEADQGFILWREDLKIDGEKLFFQLKKGEGVAQKVRVNFQGAFATGKLIEVKKERIDLEEATFTTCDRPTGSHYHVWARHITVYPETDWVVAYLGVFWLDGVPLVPIPTFVYNIGERRRNSPPLPEIGYDQEFGWYAYEKIDYYINEKARGKVHINFIQKEDIGGGVNHFYNVDDFGRGDVRVFYSPLQRWYGGLTHIYSFVREEREGNFLGEPFFNLLWQERKLQNRVTLNLTYRERINYERVSYLPDISWELKNVAMRIPNVYFNSLVGFGQISEENNLRDNRMMLRSGLDYDYNLDAITKFIAEVNGSYSDYAQGERWLKLKGKIGLARQWNRILFTGLGYGHYFFVDGTSPFRFETYRFSSYDELEGKTELDFESLRLGVDAIYTLPLQEFREIDYTLALRVHCLEMVFTWRALRQEFLLGMNLIVL